jgi:hypothetical protein
MIDYDHCEKCDADKKECIKKMLNAIGIHNGGKRKTYKRKTQHKRKTYKRKTYKRKRQHRRITYNK